MMSYDLSITQAELDRYNRQISIPEFGLPSQQKLKASRVLIIGAGGLGSAMLLYLAAAGVGTIGMVDFDVVDESNLQRQVLYCQADIGQPKVEAAERRLKELNPHLSIVTYNTKLSLQNAMSIIKDYDLVADGTDNFPARYLINDACVLLDRPDVYASVYRFEGQLSVFNHRDKQGNAGPNYRDLYPTPPHPGQVPDCAEGGVLGVLPGIMGCLQASEVIKIITGCGEPMSGRLFIFDALHFNNKTVTIKRNPANPLNADKPTLTTLADDEQWNGANATDKPVKEISPRELFNLQLGGADFQLIDVREPIEFQLVNIDAELIPLSALSSNVGLISKDKKVVIHCKSGGRSARAIRELERKFGFENLYHLKGGLFAYIDEVRPDLAKY